MFFDCKELSELKADRELFHSDNLQSVSGMFKSSSISISDIDQIGWPKEDVEREDFMKGSGWKSKFKPVDGGTNCCSENLNNPWQNQRQDPKRDPAVLLYGWVPHKIHFPPDHWGSSLRNKSPHRFRWGLMPGLVVGSV